MNRIAAMPLPTRRWLLAAAAAAAVHPWAAQAQNAGGAAPSASPSTLQRGVVSGKSARLPRGSGTRFVYRADGKRLTEVLQDFSASIGLPAVMGEGVDGIVNANFDTTPDLFLDAVSRAYGILWYHDGSALYFYPGKSIQTRLFRLKGFRRQQVLDFLHSLDLGDQRFPLKFNSTQNTLLASGPPRHIELIAQALDSLDIGAAEGNQKVVRVFSLNFASAGDRVLGNTTIPGLTSVLRNLYASPGTAPATSDSAESSRPVGQRIKALQSVYGSGKLVPDLPSPTHGGGAAHQEKPSGGASGRGMRSPINFEEDTPGFEADEGTNSVIVFGRAHKMREYEALVRRLDKKPVLVELEVMIIDVGTDDVRSLGVDWSLTGQRHSVSLTSPGNATPTAGAQELVSQGVYTLGTVISNAGREFVMRVNALQGEGKARIVSKPSILGVANRPAVMREKRVATVRVAGNLEANLFQVEAGTMVQVTPQVISNGDLQRIKLSLYIEDGSFETRLVDQVPVVKKTEIRTEAHVREGESLLIGGITVESESEQQTGVPLLKSIPLIGGMFRWDGKRASRNERLFLITPRLVDLSRAAKTAASQMSSASSASATAAPASPAASQDRPLAAPTGDGY